MAHCLQVNMLKANKVVGSLLDFGYRTFTGVPCSFLTPLINTVIAHPALQYAGAASEGEALGIASGAWLGGSKAVVLCQNSGLGNLINPLTSLSRTLGIPCLILVTWRGEPRLKDEPQHQQMGEVTTALLDLLQVPWRIVSPNFDEFSAQVEWADELSNAERCPVALIVRKDTIAADDGVEPVACEARALPAREVSNWTGRPSLVRHEVIAAVREVLDPGIPIVATTGKAGRELFTLRDEARNLYVVGSMGCASGIALGVSLATAAPVAVIDGDGAALMKLGTWATIGACQPKHLIHVLVDNGCHDSTGGQLTAASSVNFPQIAQACSYHNVVSCGTLPELKSALRKAETQPGASLVHVRTAPGSLTPLGRPTVSPKDVAARFRAFVMAQQHAARPAALPRVALTQPA